MTLHDVPGSVLKAAREKAGLTWDDLEAMTGLNKSTIHRHENENRKLQTATLELWAEACGTTVEALTR